MKRLLKRLIWRANSGQGNVEFHTLKLFILHALGHHEDSINEIDNTISAGPKNPKHHYDKATLLMHLQ